MTRKDYFNVMATTWDATFDTPELARLLTHIVPLFGVQRGDHVLDVGTGTGLLIPLLRQEIGPAGSITAIDYAEHMVQRCRVKYSRFNNVTIILQDVEELDFPSESFDAITCFGVFPHLDQKVTALAKMYQVLKSGGRLIIAHALSSTEIKAHHRNASSAVAHDVLPQEPEMRQLLHRTGFSDIAITDERGYYLCLSTKL